MKVEAISIDRINGKLEEFIKTYGNVFHTYQFLSQVGKEYLCIVATENENLVGALPLVKTRKNLLKAYHIPPYIHLFGPVTNPNYKDKYHQIINVLLSALPISGHYDFKFYLENQDVIPWLENGFSVTTGQSFVIPGDVKYDFSALHSSKQRYLKKLLKLLSEGNLSIKNGASCIEDLIFLQELTGIRNRFNTHNIVLKNIIDELHEGKGYAFVIYDYNGAPISGAFCPFDSCTAYHLINASKSHEDNLLAKSNILTTFLAVQKANEKGLDFDFEGSSIPGVADFYRMMGGNPKLIFRAQKSSSFYYHLLRAGKNILSERK